MFKKPFIYVALGCLLVALGYVALYLIYQTLIQDAGPKSVPNFVATRDAHQTILIRKGPSPQRYQDLFPRRKWEPRRLRDGLRRAG